MTDKDIIFFKHPFLGEKPLLFQKPVKTIVANEWENVKKAIETVEAYCREGFYAVGFITYEAAKGFHPNMEVHDRSDLPYVFFRIYKEKKQMETDTIHSPVHLTFRPNVSKEEFHDAIHVIHDAIDRGETEQVNYTIRMKASFQQLNTDTYFAQLVAAQKANYNAHLHFGDIEIISISPELFFAWDGKMIEMRPMKGTMKRGRSAEEDTMRKMSLINSVKNRHENEMIVQLINNELSSIVIPNSIGINNFCHVETYPTVHQLTTTVIGKTKNDTTLTSIFEALFPCGSITGTNKVVTMRLIKQIESSSRNVYCGAIGIMTPEGKAIFNVPIRTLLIDRGKKEVIYGVGGGITKSSTARDEFDEVLAKTAVLNTYVPTFQLLETMLLENGKIFLLNEHLCRLQKSADYFQFPFQYEKILDELMEQVEKNARGTYKVRLCLTSEGNVKFDVMEIDDNMYREKIVALAEMHINKENPFHYHKTSYRNIYDVHKINGIFDTLLWNEDGYITEFINGNVVYEWNGKLYTPPVKDGLLAGTFRESLLKRGVIQTRSIHKDEIDQVIKWWFINSVRKWVEVTLNNEKNDKYK